jgi:hypothetical protein
MKVNDLIESIQAFLMDIFAFFIPGATFFIILWFVIDHEIKNVLPILIRLPPTSALDWFILGLLSYISGYILQGIGEGWVIKITDKLSKCLFLKHILPDIQSYDELEKHINESQWFLEARKRLASYTKADLSTLDFRELRNIAMSISPGWINYIYRYTYIWQLCLGVATGMLISSLVLLGVAISSLIPSTGIFISAASLLWLVPLLVSMVFLLNRRYRYYGITMRIPFSIALADIPKFERTMDLEPSKRRDSRIYKMEVVQMGKPTVYLAGGFHSGWQNKVVSACSEFQFYDPRSHGIAQPKQYAVWDLNHIKISDILFGVMDKDNPSGYGLALEIGYAKGLGKTIILVDEKSSKDEGFKKYFALAKESADIYFESLDEGIAYLKSFGGGDIKTTSTFEP